MSSYPILSVAVPQPERSAGDQTSGFLLRRREFTNVSCAPILDGKINPINTVAVCQFLTYAKQQRECAETGLFNHLVGTGKERGSYGKAERLRGPKVDHEPSVSQNPLPTKKSQRSSILR